MKKYLALIKTLDRKAKLGTDIENTSFLSEIDINQSNTDPQAVNPAEIQSNVSNSTDGE